MDNPHPMMLLAALRGMVGLQLAPGEFRLAKNVRRDARILKCRIDRCTIGWMPNAGLYRPAELRDIPARYWDHVSEDDLDWLDGAG